MNELRVRLRAKRPCCSKSQVSREFLEAGERLFKALAERDRPSAAASLHEGLDELFTINRLGLPSKLRRCLGTTNLIDNSYSAVRQRSARVKRWRDGSMALRWTAANFAATEKTFRRIMGHGDLWMLKAALDEPSQDQQVAQQMKASERQPIPKPTPALSTELGTSSETDKNPLQNA